ncbi:transposase [Micromonas pusilla CCMP1545]|uniref:Transposase n=1 Tax=Micromonas pusilla (strain CCMP1545) TaxID=564608 RepID=C1NAC3_MICPC|nr:transposase [Micromonas pusilla CCMP1545]EEH50919.1 transposase [Micromonas pusilla CCMP1545]|eukprot:XP_003064939.1 transposase [Micromonas pusilla CCMP1545]
MWKNDEDQELDRITDDSQLHPDVRAMKFGMLQDLRTRCEENSDLVPTLNLKGKVQMCTDNQLVATWLTPRGNSKFRPRKVTDEASSEDRKKFAKHASEEYVERAEKTLKTLLKKVVESQHAKDQEKSQRESRVSSVKKDASSTDEPAFKKQKLDPTSTYGDTDSDEEDACDVVHTERADIEQRLAAAHTEMERFKAHAFNRQVKDETRTSEGLLSWWQVEGIAFPLLREVARNIFSLPASSASSERAFSAAGQVVTHKRKMLDKARVNKLMVVKRNANFVTKAEVLKCIP